MTHLLWEDLHGVDEKDTKQIKRNKKLISSIHECYMSCKDCRPLSFVKAASTVDGRVPRTQKRKAQKM